jgi:hypothetical protein
VRSAPGRSAPPRRSSLTIPPRSFSFAVGRDRAFHEPVKISRPETATRMPAESDPVASAVSHVTQEHPQSTAVAVEAMHPQHAMMTRKIHCARHPLAVSVTSGHLAVTPADVVSPPPPMQRNAAIPEGVTHRGRTLVTSHARTRPQKPHLRGGGGGGGGRCTWPAGPRHAAGAIGTDRRGS